MLLVFPIGPISDGSCVLEAPIFLRNDLVRPEAYDRAWRNAEYAAIGSRGGVRKRGEPCREKLFGERRQTAVRKYQWLEERGPLDRRALHTVEERVSSGKILGKDQLGLGVTNNAHGPVAYDAGDDSRSEAAESFLDELRI